MLTDQDPVKKLQQIDSGIRKDIRPFEVESLQQVLEKSQFEYMHTDLNAKAKRA